MPIVSLKNINKSFKDKVILKDFSLDVEEGEFLSITGASGKGKTTLLNIIGLLEKPDSGDVFLFDTKNESFGSRKARDLRRHKLSYLFQNFGLVDNETCKFNLNLALEFSDYNREQKRDSISDALKKVGLEGFDNSKLISLTVSVLLSILSITVYEKGEGPKALLSWRIVTLGPCLSKTWLL